MDASPLAQFRADAQPVTRPKKVWQAPTAADLALGTVVAVDQSLGALGWVWLRHDDLGLDILAKGSVRTKAEDFPGSHEGTLLRGLDVYDRFGEQVDKAFDARPHVWPYAHFVHETPPVGGRMARPESSLVSAMAVRIFISRQIGHPMTMVANQHSKAVLVGNANATKREWHRGLAAFEIGGVQPTNEGERDALCLAITHLYDLKRSEP